MRNIGKIQDVIVGAVEVFVCKKMRMGMEAGYCICKCNFRPGGHTPKSAERYEKMALGFKVESTLYRGCVPYSAL